MDIEIRLPELGEGIAAGDIVNVLVKVGDTITKDQPILEIETDKAVVEVPSDSAGRIAKVHVKSGQKVKIGELLFQLDSNGAAPSKEQPAAATASKEAPAPTPAPEKAAAIKPSEKGESKLETILLPALGEGITGGDIVNVLVKAGDTITKDQPILEIETDKAVVEVPSSAAGTVKEVKVQAGKKVKVGEAILDLMVSSGAAPTPTSAQPAPVAAKEAPAPSTATPKTAEQPKTKPDHSLPHNALDSQLNNRLIPAGPATRRFARELGVDLSQVIGTGPGARIVIEDIKAYVRNNGVGASSTGSHAVVAAPLPDFSQWGAVEIKPLPSLRRKISEQMALAWTIPMVTHFDKADITELELFRKRHTESVKKQGGSFTVTPFAIKACVEALKAFPQCNASIDLAKGEVIYKHHYHIGVAVDTDNGLIVPVIKNADQKSLIELAKELALIAQKARDRKLTVEDLRGATFTISNLGGIGGTQFTPIVNPPQVAILGISRGEQQPVWKGAAFEPRLMMPLCVTYDHRLIDGADGARFTRRIVQGLEEFASRLLEI